MLIGIDLLVGAGRDVAHGHEGAGFDVCGGVFPWLADIEEAGLVFAEKRGGVRWGDFVVEHGIQCRTRGIPKNNRRCFAAIAARPALNMKRAAFDCLFSHSVNGAELDGNLERCRRF